jgi:uncharacterized metal-binding protein
MAIECAKCASHACRLGRADVAPSTCPMRGPFPPFESLYLTEDVRRLAYHAARVEAEGYCRWTRVHEIVELARRMNYQRIGLAHCPDMRREATLAAGYLQEQGIDALLPPEAADCDPIGQAQFFARHATAFNAITGMCVGHDTLFIRHARGPVTSLVVRDRRLRHNPVAALYLRNGYFSAALRSGVTPSHRISPPHLSDEELGQIARAVRDMRRTDPPCRIEEVMDFARLAAVWHLGIAYCSGFREEARDLHSILAANGCAVSSVCCKAGAVPKQRLGIRSDEQVRPGEPEMICNALAQAELLEQDPVGLVLLLGQCVGHDSATMARLGVPVVCVAAKDRVLGHNTVAALYELERSGRETRHLRRMRRVRPQSPIGSARATR